MVYELYPDRQIQKMLSTLLSKGQKSKRHSIEKTNKKKDPYFKIGKEWKKKGIYASTWFWFSIQRWKKMWRVFKWLEQSCSIVIYLKVDGTCRKHNERGFALQYMTKFSLEWKATKVRLKIQWRHTRIQYTAVATLMVKEMQHWWLQHWWSRNCNTDGCNTDGQGIATLMVATLIVKEFKRKQNQPVSL